MRRGHQIASRTGCNCFLMMSNIIIIFIHVYNIRIFDIYVFGTSNFPLKVFMLEYDILHNHEIGHVISDFRGEITCCNIFINGIRKYIVYQRFFILNYGYVRINLTVFYSFFLEELLLLDGSFSSSLRFDEVLLVECSFSSTSLLVEDFF